MAAEKITRGLFLKAIANGFIFLLVLCLNCRDAGSKSAADPMDGAAGQSVNVYRYQQINSTGEKVNTIDPPEDIESHQIIPFKDDMSGGSAALATILKFTFDWDVKEKDVIKGLLAYGDKESIEKKEAFSFYDMKYFLAAAGYTGTGYIIEGPISPEQFQEDGFRAIRNRAIIPVAIDGYAHLAVYRSFDNQYVYLGSPLYGNICMSFDDLRKVIIRNSIFIVEKPALSKK